MKLPNDIAFPFNLCFVLSLAFSMLISQIVDKPLLTIQPISSGMAVFTILVFYIVSNMRKDDRKDV